MLQPPPGRPGMREDEVDTPALLIDLDAFEANLDHMAELLAPTGTKLRAHAKTHKSPVIAKLQMARGAVGQCVQKVAEAEVLAWGGIPISWSATRWWALKLARLAALARIAKVAVCADDAAQVAAIERRQRMPASGCRCWSRSMSVPHAAASRRPACGGAREAHRRVAHLIFGGLQAYHGSAQHKRTVVERARLESATRCDASRRTSSSCVSKDWTARSSAARGRARSSIEAVAASTPRSRRVLRLHGRGLCA